eukprot:ANDGO_07245.mRNA.1 hypothetical protein
MIEENSPFGLQKNHPSWLAACISAHVHCSSLFCATRNHPLEYVNSNALYRVRKAALQTVPFSLADTLISPLDLVVESGVAPSGIQVSQFRIRVFRREILTRIGTHELERSVDELFASAVNDVVSLLKRSSTGDLSTEKTSLTKNEGLLCRPLLHRLPPKMIKRESLLTDYRCSDSTMIDCSAFRCPFGSLSELRRFIFDGIAFCYCSNEQETHS